jgi:hypothetical protein
MSSSPDAAASAALTADADASSSIPSLLSGLSEADLASMQAVQQADAHEQDDQVQSSEAIAPL